MNCSTPGNPVHHQLLEFTQIHVHWVSDAIQPSHPLSSPSPPAPNPSQHQGLFQRVNSLHEWPKYWSFSFSISPSNEHPGLISFRMDWFDLPAVQGTLKSLLQHHSPKASVFRLVIYHCVTDHSHPSRWKQLFTKLTRQARRGRMLLLRVSRGLSRAPVGAKRLYSCQPCCVSCPHPPGWSRLPHPGNPVLQSTSPIGKQLSRLYLRHMCWCPTG